MTTKNRLPPLSQTIVRKIGQQKWKCGPGQSANVLHLDGGKMVVPDNEYDQFLQTYVQSLEKKEINYLIEAKTEFFPFFMDLDYKMTQFVGNPEDQQDQWHNIEPHVKIIHDMVATFLDENASFCWAIVCLQTHPKKVYPPLIEFGCHLVWDYFFVNKEQEMVIRHYLVTLMSDKFPDLPWQDILDASVYKKNGLRIIGSYKAIP